MQAWTPSTGNERVRSSPWRAPSPFQRAPLRKPSECGATAVKGGPLSCISEMGAVEDFASLAHAHWEFACWQRVRHSRSGHRKAVEDICTDLDSVQYEARCCLYKIVRRHGEFRGSVNGWWFEDPEKTSFRPRLLRVRIWPGHQTRPRAAAVRSSQHTQLGDERPRLPGSGRAAPKSYHPRGKSAPRPRG